MHALELPHVAASVDRWYYERAEGIRAKRKALGWSIQRAADKAGIGYATWWKIEDGRGMHEESLVRALAALGLLGGEHKNLYNFGMIVKFDADGPRARVNVSP